MIFALKKYELTNHPDELVARRKHKWMIYLAVGFLVFVVYNIAKHFASMREAFMLRPIASSIIFLFIFYLAGMLFFLSLDKRPKLIINKEGIWTAKRQLAAWQNIYYYCFNERKGKSVTTYLEIRLINPEEYFEVVVSELDKSIEELEYALDKNKSGTAFHLGKNDLTPSDGYISHF